MNSLIIFGLDTGVLFFSSFGFVCPCPLQEEIAMLSIIPNVSFTRNNRILFFNVYSFYNIAGIHGKCLIGRKIRIFCKDKIKNKLKFRTKQSQEY